MPLFTNAVSELKYFLANISQAFSGYTGSNGQPLGERGIDVGLPYDTPIYATAPGKVLGTIAQYGGGGVVSIEVTSKLAEYYQHLSSEVVKAGQTVVANQLIGYSGGQLGYGNNPAGPAYSTGPHIEIGFNGPWGSPWDALGPNFNPVPDLSAQESALASGATTVNYPSGGSGSTTSGSSSLNNVSGASCGPQPNPSNYKLGSADPQYQLAVAQWIACNAQNSASNIGNTISDPIGTALTDIGTWFNSTFGITSGADLAWRILFIGVAIFLFLLAIIIIVLDLLDKSNVEVAGTRV
jgi:hypothetical protein